MLPKPPHFQTPTLPASPLAPATSPRPCPLLPKPGPPRLGGGGGGVGEARLQHRTLQGCCGPRSCLPGAVIPGAETARRAEPGAGRGSSSSRCPPPLLPDSVQGTELREGAGLQPRFRPPPPPPLPQTEDAPWRLEACVSSGARKSGLCWAALETPRLGARARAPASGSVCLCARAHGVGESRGEGKGGRDARRDRGEILHPRKSVNLGRRMDRASRLKELPAGRRQRGRGRQPGARGLWIERGWAERSARSHGCRGGGAQSPLSQLSRRGRAARSRHRCPDSGRVREGAGGGQQSGPHGYHCNTGAPGPMRGRAEDPGARGSSLAGAGWCEGCRRGVGGGIRPSAAHRLAWVQDAERGAGRRSVEDAVSLHGWVAGGASHSRWNVALFPSWRPLFLQVIHIPGKSVSLLCSDSANCADSWSVPLWSQAP